jgi:hypothetical protein
MIMPTSHTLPHPVTAGLLSALGCTIAVLGGCGFITGPRLDPLELNTDADLYGLDYTNSGFVAVGAGGVVAHEKGMTWDLGDIDLRAVANYPKPYDELLRLVVVGDQGYAAYGVGVLDDSLTWTELDPPLGGDFRAIAMFDPRRLLLVGEEILVVGEEGPDGAFEWTQPVPPDGGWGSLRAIHFDPRHEPSFVVAGDAGRLLTSSDGFAWTTVELDIQADLRCVTRDGAYGSGVWVKLTELAWDVHVPDPPVNYLACDLGFFVTDDRQVHYPAAGFSAKLDWQAHAVRYGAFVGENGRAARYAEL